MIGANRKLNNSSSSLRPAAADGQKGVFKVWYWVQVLTHSRSWTRHSQADSSYRSMLPPCGHTGTAGTLQIHTFRLSSLGFHPINGLASARGGGFGGKTVKTEPVGVCWSALLSAFCGWNTATAEEQRWTSWNKYGANNMILSSVTFHQLKDPDWVRKSENVSGWKSWTIT